MGCDIHFVIEKKYPSAWVGVYFSDEYKFRRKKDWDDETPIERLDSRNYSFFGLLANVRRGGQPGSEEPRELPDDISSWSRGELEEGANDYHTPSWHSLEEFVKKFLLSTADDDKKTELMAAKLRGASPIHNFLPRIQTEEWHMYRVIFWFDN